MASLVSGHENTIVRPCHYGDLDDISGLIAHLEGLFGTESRGYSPPHVAYDLSNLKKWYGPLKLLSWFPNPLQHYFSAYVAEVNSKVCGVIQVAPCNQTRSTWRIERITSDSGFLNSSEDCASGSVSSSSLGAAILPFDIASRLLRHCLEEIWEARTWMVEVSVNDKAGIRLYRHHGFQPLAQMTYWSLDPQLLSVLSEHEANVPNLRSVSNADASLLHQLDTVSMPPLVRQVFDRQVSDFRSSLAESTFESVERLTQKHEIQNAYVFEPQRKAAIGYYRLEISRGDRPLHHAHLTVHPAYTWLYPELLTHMARVLQGYPNYPLQIASSDYQPEREEYLTKIGAERVEHTLIMSRSVWHKVRETKPSSLEGLQIAEVFQGLKPSRKPVPGRFSLNSAFPSDFESNFRTMFDDADNDSVTDVNDSSTSSSNGMTN